MGIGVNRRGKSKKWTLIEPEDETKSNVNQNGGLYLLRKKRSASALAKT